MHGSHGYRVFYYFYVVAGNGMLYDTAAREAKGLHNVLLPGWLDRNKMTALLRASSVGIVPWSKKRYTLPNKFFVYLSVDLPVVSSCAGEVKHFLSRNHIWFPCEPNDHEQLAARIMRLQGDRDSRGEMSKNAVAFNDEFLDTNKVYDAFADHVERIALNY